MGTTLPTGAWSATVVEQFLHGQRISFTILAALVTLITMVGARSLTSSRAAEEH